VTIAARCSAEYSGSFKETAPRKTAENTAKHRGGGVGSVIASHRGGSESSMVVTTLHVTYNLAHNLSLAYLRDEQPE